MGWEVEDCGVEFGGRTPCIWRKGHSGPHGDLVIVEPGHVCNDKSKTATMLWGPCDRPECIAKREAKHEVGDA